MHVRTMNELYYSKMQASKRLHINYTEKIYIITVKMLDKYFTKLATVYVILVILK